MFSFFPLREHDNVNALMSCLGMVAVVMLCIWIPICSQTSASPLWKPNTYFECEPYFVEDNDITTMFNSANPITKTIPFTKAYSSVPQLAFGIKNYRGSDKLIEEMFAISRKNLTQTDFTVYTMINGTTNIRIFNIIYLAVDRSFPYHLNIFSDIAVNYPSSALSALGSVSSSNSGQRTYTNTLNYTQLAQNISSSYEAFGSDLSKNHVALYLSAIYVNADRDKFVKYTVDNTINNSTAFTIKVTCQDGLELEVLRFAIVAMDIKEFEDTGLFTIVFQYLTLDATIENYITIPAEFAPGTFIGLLDFSATKGHHGLQFNWELDLPNDRVVVNASIPYSGSSASGYGGLLQYKLNVFYVKTWDCPTTHPYFNLNTDMCDDYCLKYHYGNLSAAACQPCQNTTCYECDSGAAQPCTGCDSANDFRHLVGTTCECMPGYYEDPSGTSTVCLSCVSVVPNCATCSNATSVFSCSTCDPNFAIDGTGVCIPCVIPNCITSDATSGTCVCTVCDSANNYVTDGSGGCTLCTLNECTLCATSAQCSVCNAANNYFLNTGTGLCEVCTLTQCLTCASLSTCTTCNEAADFFLSSTAPTTGTCVACSQTGCLDCLSAVQCVTCDEPNDYFLNTGTLQCIPCALSQCLDCATNSTCTTCNEASDFFLNPVSFLCEACTLVECLDCFNATECITCNTANDYFLNPVTKVCDACSLTECLDCLSAAQCLTCNTANDYFLDAVSQTCLPCSLTGCLDCASAAQCATCDTANDYFLNPVTLVCDPCSLTECTDCLSATQCLTCNNGNGYFLNGSNQLCEPCTLTGCLTCATLSTCSVCDIGSLYDLDTVSQLCFYCDPLLNMFVNSSSLCETCSLSHCVTCSSLTTCSLCDQINGFLNPASQLCEPCPLVGCLTCSTYSVCQTCDNANNYFLMGGVCEQCPVTCLCDGYVMPKVNVSGIEYCSTTCGDGLLRNFEQCDDGNLNDGDGCNSVCEVESSWICAPVGNSSCCTVDSTQIELQINSITKPSLSNSIQVEVQIVPSLAVLTKGVLENSLEADIIGIALFDRKMQVHDSEQIVFLTYSYNTSIHGSKGEIVLSLNLSQSDQPSCLIQATKSLTVYAQASNNLPFMFYSEEDLAEQENVTNAVEVLQYLCFALLFLSLFVAKIVGLEMMGVMQLAYFALAQQENVNALLESFMKMNELNGFNLHGFVGVEQSSQTPDSISSLSYNSLFLNNCNIMLLVIIAEIVVAAILYLLGHLLSSVSETMSSISKRMIKEVLLTLLIFNAFNISFGVGVHFQYSEPSESGYAISTFAAIACLILLFSMCLALTVTSAEEFGEYRQKFKPDLPCQLYFVFTILYRFALGYYIAVRAEYTLSSLVVICFSLIFIGYNLVHLPFNDTYQNYRACTCHFVQLIILFVTNYYDSMKENEPLEEKAYLSNGAYFQLVALYFCFGVSLCCLIVEIYKWIVAQSSSRNQIAPNSDQRIAFDESFNDLQKWQIQGVEEETKPRKRRRKPQNQQSANKVEILKSQENLNISEQ